MHLFHFYTYRYRLNTIPGLKLIFTWFAGLSLGLWTACRYGDTIVPFIEPAARAGATWLNLIFVTVLPLLLSACAVFLLRFPGLFGVCFLRSFFLGVMLGGVTLRYGGAAILMAPLLMFSALCYSPVLLWYWQRRIDDRFCGLHREIVPCLALGLGIGTIDYLFISPFLVHVINL